MSPLGLFHSVRRSIIRDGWCVTLQRAIAKFRTSGIRGERNSRSDFDQKFGVDTDGSIDLFRLGVRGDRLVHGTRYQPINAAYFQHVLARLPIDPSKYVFLDIGCGKGRALLLASQMRFKRVIGVEISEELCKIARENVVVQIRSGAGSGAIEILHTDALSLEFPEHPLIVFLYNPFDETILSPFLERLRDSLQRCPRDCWLPYLNAIHLNAFSKAAGFAEVESSAIEHTRFAVFRWTPQATLRH